MAENNSTSGTSETPIDPNAFAKDMASLKEGYEALKKEYAALQEQIKASPKVDPALVQDIAALKKGLAALIKENGALLKQLKEQPVTAESKPAEIPALPTDTFRTDKGTYKFVVRQFKHKGVLISAIDALTDPAILDELVRVGSGVIAEVE